ncbi:MAG: hypothetical protein JST54_14540 [Deltaproteobacteria bacterium]|nr:hypothetical protein [Deltaproteobacteria bacterium]
MADVDPKLLPPEDGDAPLQELTRDQLSAFLYNAFDDEELLELCRKAKVQTSGGYRLDTLSGIERADLLGDEIRAVPKARAAVVELLREIYEYPALAAVVLPEVVADELASMASEPDFSVRLLWRLLADPTPGIRQRGRAGLEYLADALFGKHEESARAPTTPIVTTPTPGVVDTADTRALKKEARRAGQLAERAREKAASLKEQLRDARALQQQSEREAAARSKEAAKLQAELERTKDKLQKAREKGKHDDLERLEKERAELASRVATLEEKVRHAAEAREKLEAELEASVRQLEEQKKRPEPAATVDADQPEAVPASWLFPRFTREFYDSLDRWDPRIQRAAFKQAMLLAENHRHPSLRAIPLEGLPGYYRVRIATDVRLIYRRSANEREVELLSLIDREDLDRYVRQAKTR